MTVRGMSYARDLTDEQWELREAVFNAPGMPAASTPKTCAAL